MKVWFNRSSKKKNTCGLLSLFVQLAFCGDLELYGSNSKIIFQSDNIELSAADVRSFKLGASKFVKNNREPQPCNANSQGSVYFDTADNVFYGCDGWEYLRLSAPPTRTHAPTKATSAPTYATTSPTTANPTTSPTLNTDAPSHAPTPKCVATLLDDIPFGSWGTTWTCIHACDAPNPQVIWKDTDQGFAADGTGSITGTCSGNTYGHCSTKVVGRTFDVPITVAKEGALQVYFKCTSEMQTYNAASITISLYPPGGDISGSSRKSFSRANCHGSHHSGSFTYLPSPEADGRYRLDLSSFSKGPDFEFDKIQVSMNNYACIGSNTATIDQITFLRGPCN